MKKNMLKLLGLQRRKKLNLNKVNKTKKLILTWEKAEAMLRLQIIRFRHPSHPNQTQWNKIFSLTSIKTTFLIQIWKITKKIIKTFRAGKSWAFSRKRCCFWGEMCYRNPFQQSVACYRWDLPRNWADVSDLAFQLENTSEKHYFTENIFEIAEFRQMAQSQTTTSDVSDGGIVINDTVSLLGIPKLATNQRMSNDINNGSDSIAVVNYPLMKTQSQTDEVIKSSTWEPAHGRSFVFGIVLLEKLWTKVVK